MTTLKWAAALLLALGPVAQDKAPEPDAAVQKEKLKVIKDLFKDDYAKKAPQDQIALAKQLINRGRETASDPAGQYVMLREARDLAAGAGDVDTALKAVDEIGKVFAIPSAAFKLAALAKATTVSKDPETGRAAARAYLALISEAIRGDDFDTAVAAAGKGELAAKAAQDPVLPGKIQELQKELPGLKSEYQKVKADLDKATPADPEAVGRYLCFVRGAWDTGLIHLSIGAKPPLKTAVDKDLAKPAEPLKQLEAGDAWWELAQKEKSPWRKVRLVGRAQSWYEQASASATGLDKVKIDKRLAEIEDSQPGALNLLRLIDVKQEAFGEWTFEGGALLSNTDNYTRVMVPYTPPEEFDLTAVVERLQGTDAILFGMIRGTTQYAVWIEGFSNMGGRSGLEMVDGMLFDKNPQSKQGVLLASGKPSTVVISVRKTSITASVDGASFVNFTGNFSRMNGLNVAFWKVVNWKGMYLGTCGTRYKITKLSLVTVSGQGKKLR
ncbi:MAG: hypothetical protein HY293_03505 [Planctomycetes bacterium]|nr:hypothetical protein [Planctomycetota bacterium]